MTTAPIGLSPDRRHARLGPRVAAGWRFVGSAKRNSVHPGHIPTLVARKNARPGGRPVG